MTKGINGKSNTASRILETLKRKCDFVSGEEMSVGLGITRAAVWKHITALRKKGYSIKSATNRGYRLLQSPDILNADEITDGAGTGMVGRRIIYFDEIGSTNAIAKKIAADGAAEGTVIIAGDQTSGRGRFGREWFSGGSEGVYISVILKPNSAAADVAGMTLIAGLAVCKALRDITLEYVLIKWPNDVILNGKKLCGILTELSAECERIDYLIIGIGINVNNENFPEEIRDRATSVFIETGTKYSRKAIIHKVMAYLEKYYLRYSNDHSLSGIISEYSGLCATLGNDIEATHHGIKICGKATGIDDSGSLLIRKADGTVISVNSGEVSVRGINGYV